MGQRLTSNFRRQEETVQAVDISNENAYRWPPKAGNYFGSHFIMGGERFESQQPEAFLFGENTDLNFLGNRPVPFPYSAPQLGEPTRTLRSLVNIRKDTIRLVKCDPPTNDGEGRPAAAPESQDVEAADTEPDDQAQYNLEFSFDSDVTCNITVMYFAKEEIDNGVVVYTPADPGMNSETYTYKKGANQLFSQSTHIMKPSDFPEEKWMFDFDQEEIPIVIHCTVEKEREHAGHSHATFCSVEKLNDGYSVKPVKQKQCVDGLLYILQEFYGIENKECDASPATDDDEDVDDNTAECVICMCDIRDTLILPCRHLCLCNGCADSLRYQANNCPICRSPFRALLQLRAIKKKGTKPETETNTGSEDDDEFTISQKGVPQGYEAISLIEALNGPCFYSKSADPRQRVLASQGSLRRSKKKKKDCKGSRITLKEKDKDVIAGEEKAAKDQPQEETKPADSHTEGNDDEAEEQPADAEKPLPKSEDSSDEAVVDKEEKQTSSAAQEEDDGNDRESQPKQPDAGKRLSNGSGSTSSDEDTFDLSARTNETNLPGTPDHVLDESIDDDNEV